MNYMYINFHVCLHMLHHHPLHVVLTFLFGHYMYTVLTQIQTIKTNTVLTSPQNVFTVECQVQILHNSTTNAMFCGNVKIIKMCTAQSSL